MGVTPDALTEKLSAMGYEQISLTPRNTEHHAHFRYNNAKSGIVKLE